MAITPTSDFVLDVAQAADPERLKEAKARLEAQSASAASGSDQFQSVVDTLSAQTPPTTGGANATMIKTVTSAARTIKQPSVGQKFEAQVLKSFIEYMMPQHSDNAFGSGFAGEVSKTFLAEALANQLAAHGGIGIAKHINAAASAPRTNRSS